MLKRGKKIYEGKANTLYETDDPYILEMECTDRISAGDGAKKSVVASKGLVNNLVSTELFKRFEAAGIPTHFVSEGTNEQSKFVRNCSMIALEVIGRNKAAGSFCKRFGVQKGMEFHEMVLELSFKDDALNDPMISSSAAVALCVATWEDLKKIKEYTCKINEVAKAFFAELGLTLVDFKVEYGIDSETGELLLCDEFSQDTCRLWDENGNSLDKDIFRNDSGNVTATYQKLLSMIQK